MEFRADVLARERLADGPAVVLDAARVDRAQHGCAGRRGADVSHAAAHFRIAVPVRTRCAGRSARTDADPTAIGASVVGIAIIRRIVDAFALSGTREPGDAAAERPFGSAHAVVLDAHAPACSDAGVAVSRAVTPANRIVDGQASLRARLTAALPAALRIR